MAAEQGIAEAQFILGAMYDNGRGVPQDDAEAAKWYRLAADQGQANAQFLLGVMYGQPGGLLENHAEAAKWYRRAAEQGTYGAPATKSHPQEDAARNRRPPDLVGGPKNRTTDYRPVGCG